MKNIQETKVEDLIKDKNRLLNEVQASRVLNLSYQTLKRALRYNGRIPFYRMNSRISYKVSDLLAYIDSCRIEKTN
jgi:hypothetical protein